MKKQQLASLIWDTCNDLRGSISAVEYKDIILGLIFYRFISEKEVSNLRAQGWSDEDITNELDDSDIDTKNWCQEHLGYYIINKNLFSSWIARSESDFNVSDVTDALNAFIRNVGSKKGYQKLYNEIFKSLSEKLSKIGTISEQTTHLKKVIKIVNRIPMNEKRDYDVLGFIYEFLLKNFASNSKKDGEFYTPHEISVLMSEIIAHHLQDRNTINILDPTSGSGSLLINIGQGLQKYLNLDSNITYYAQELIQETYNLTRMNLIMRGINPANINVRRGDTLSKDWPYFDDTDENSYRYIPVDCVVSNPPYSHKWDADSHTNDPRYRSYGIAPASKADYAFLLHELYHLKDDGIMCIVMPHGVLFRGGSEKDIRTKLVENNNIETIIGLPQNIFYGTSISTIILVLKKHRVSSDILIVDASREFFKDGNKNRLSGHNIRKIIDTVLKREDVPHFASLVAKSKVKQNDYNLNIARYVQAEDTLPYDLHATVFGGIPNYEIDHLKEYWEAFPTLRDEIFERENEHTSTIRCASVKDTIMQNADSISFTESYTEVFGELEEELYKMLIDGKIENVHGAKEEITAKIFANCCHFDIVDKYLVYKAFDDSWEQISADVEAISEQGFDAARKTEPVEMYDKKAGDAVVKGEEGAIIPFALIQKHLYSDDYERMESLKRELESTTADYDSLWEEFDDELKGDLKKQDSSADDEQEDVKIDTKQLAKRYQEIISALSNDMTRKYDEYFAMKPKQKVVFQSEHTELTWPPETEKTKNGVYKQPAVRTIVESIKNEIEIPEDDDDYKIRRLYLLGQQITSLKKQIKDLKTDLDINARKDIVGLQDDVIKALLKEKWLSPVMQGINSIPNSIKRELNRTIQDLITKYQYPITELDTEIDKTENILSGLLGDLSGNDYDMAAINEMIKLLGGENNE